MVPSDDVFSQDPCVRKQALHDYSELLAKDPNSAASDILSFAELLKLVVRDDPDPNVRCTALSLSQCPVDVLHEALNSSDVEAREAAIRAISEQPHGQHSKPLLQHIPLEPNPRILHFALKALDVLLSHNAVPNNSISRALGIPPTPNGPLDAFDCEGVLRECAEHEEHEVRTATAEVLATIVAKQEPVAANEAFFTLEQLLRDADGRVAIAALCALSRILPTQHELRLSEKCVRAILVRFSSPSTRADIFKVLAGFPCKSLKAYAVLQTFVRRRLYKIASGIVTTNRELEEVQQGLVEIVRCNQDFARVLDLRESQSQKMIRLIES
ncbi:hypothetical protein BWQ96_00107 [Gracilariopsis chorda]|uniref:Uncharacterized protein n=1 Tax=Gracilariopsis chorda TaxID=448386 RepID=A0A2V3J7V8_9FLOR|nr:hypothetical protein BWQ96_00107 [Gracilariopsis chorda]|eukprot:PXF49947.1 hypothetical protein BWQ96_00107 [Gracilariopsis chorda]